MGQDLENMTSPASMPADGLSKPRSRKGAQTGFRHLCKTLVPTKNLESTVEWLADKTEFYKTKQNELLIQENCHNTLQRTLMARS